MRPTHCMFTFCISTAVYINPALSQYLFFFPVQFTFLCAFMLQHIFLPVHANLHQLNFAQFKSCTIGCLRQFPSSLIYSNRRRLAINVNDIPLQPPYHCHIPPVFAVRKSCSYLCVAARVAAGLGLSLFNLRLSFTGLFDNRKEQIRAVVSINTG